MMCTNRERFWLVSFGQAEMWAESPASNARSTEMRYADVVRKVRVVPPEALNLRQRQVLERAVGKLVLIGERVGVTADDMILLLQSGLTVRELLDYLAACERPVV